MSGSGKTRIMSWITGENLEERLLFSHPMHLHKKLSINNNEYHCTFLKPLSIMLPGDNHDVKEEMVKSNNREILKRLNLIIYVVKGSCYSGLDALHMYTKFLKNTHSISALVFTHCGYNDAKRSRFVEGFKSIDCFKDFAASMGKGIYTVDFPDLDYFDEDKEQIKQIMQKDVTKLHQLIEESSDVVDVFKSNDPGVPSNQCAII